MANTFKNARLAITGGDQTIYTAPASAGNVAIVLQLQVANVDNSGAQSISATVIDSTGGTTTHLCKALSVPANAAASLVSGKLVLEAGDSVKLQGTGSSLLEAQLSALEIT